MNESGPQFAAVDHIRAERTGDSLAIEEVVRQAFGREDEANLAAHK